MDVYPYDTYSGKSTARHPDMRRWYDYIAGDPGTPITEFTKMPTSASGKGDKMSPMLKALQAVKNGGYSPGSGQPRERLALINPLERRILELLGGSGRLTKSGVPSFSLRDNTGPKGSTDTHGGTGGAGTAGGGDRGSNYTFSNYQSNPNIQGNWNTGGDVTGYGSMAGGINQVAHPRVAARLSIAGNPAMPPPVAQPPLPPMVQAVVPPAIPIPRQAPRPIGTAIDYFDAQFPGGLNASTFPARPGVSPMAPGLNTRGPWGRKDQSRLGTGPGFTGGGRGGGGGGGWR